ncbi:MULTISPECIES: UbiD family decarboxylase [unclassified Mucilaginibacter]|uniref:UbiD family decarboxylase n=1 Tax=unclassified Mucilaginibacter TaxID=2617802 RepID=UPI002AC89F5C|nr:MULTISPECIES: UbiD family decarboxylase [unclassified Mucilaginibacter]MEB0260582.1 UbiD family decarboxylase [Mucilaginibacter sp. 10I4]MEB0278063.1 UbiD family decarboxylase [Mucilaginibacter sp. 10B2]MEB0302407.1 UbiD family decarboxylase [Mucilaginibacter sp. 5C4]WPX22974.1 UbiD family decarboxylase [Mucilaginibacter sp. 5C4]
MGYNSLQACITDLEKNGHLIRIKEEVDPYLQMAAIHLRVFEHQGPAILFENVKGSKFPAVSNLFGTLDRSRFIFRDTLEKIKTLIDIKNDPIKAIKHPFKYANTAMTALSALPMKVRKDAPISFDKALISDIPQIVNWPKDGGPFVTMPQVYTEDADMPGIMNANLGMYRIQLGGNDYVQDKEIGLHYQLHRGIGVHQTKANAKGQPLKVSIFVGGPPAHPVAAVMPLPEGLSEMTFGGALGNRRFRYFYDDEGFCISADADFVITGTVMPMENKPEGPFGDHLGYYSLAHPFPLMKVHNVYHKKDAIWSFTVVGRPPQEDTSFGALIHEITGSAIPKEIPGLHAVNAVDAAGVHPLLFAIGSERYTPYVKERYPQEIITIANHILGKGQLSLAKYLFIAAKEDNPSLDVNDIGGFLKHILQRIDLTRDLHFHTRTTIDTLDYSGDGLNSGSKVAITVAGDIKRELWNELPSTFTLPRPFVNYKIVMPGVLAVEVPKNIRTSDMPLMLEILQEHLAEAELSGLPLMVLCDDATFTAQSINNFVWVTFTRSNPSHDIYGINSFTEHKHWGCNGPLMIDARIKPHHAPVLERDPEVEKLVDKMGEIGGVLHGII